MHTQNTALVRGTTKNACIKIIFGGFAVNKDTPSVVLSSANSTTVSFMTLDHRGAASR